MRACSLDPFGHGVDWTRLGERGPSRWPDKPFPWWDSRLNLTVLKNATERAGGCRRPSALPWAPSTQKPSRQPAQGLHIIAQLLSVSGVLLTCSDL